MIAALISEVHLRKDEINEPVETIYFGGGTPSVLSTEEIEKKLVETKEELFNLRFQQATGNLEKPSRIRELRHTVARMKTVLKERELNTNE